MNKESLEYILLIAITLIIALVLSLILRKLLGVFIKKYAQKLKANPTNFSFVRNSVDLKAYIWSVGNDNAFSLKCDLLKSVKQRFDAEGVEIPFPYRTIVYKKDIKNG